MCLSGLLRTCVESNTNTEKKSNRVGESKDDFCDDEEGETALKKIVSN